MSVNPVKNPLTLKVPPVLFVNVATPLFGLYVPPVTNISSGNPKYVDADIVNALKDCVNNVFPLTVPPVNPLLNEPSPITYCDDVPPCVINLSAFMYWK